MTCWYIALRKNKVYMLVVNASNIEKDWNWISKFNTDKVEMHNISDKTCLLAIQGPNATKMLQPLTDIDILNLKYYTFTKGKFAGVDNDGGERYGLYRSGWDRDLF